MHERLSMSHRSTRELALGFGLASAVFGVTFGVIATAQGMSAPLVMVTSLLVFGGGAQFGALGVVAAGGSAAAAIGVGLALNSRFLLMGLPVAARLPTGHPGRRALLAALSIDGSLVAAMTERDDTQVERAYRDMGLIIFGLWQLGTGVGIVAGGWLSQPEVFGVDALIPAVFLGLLLPLLEDAATRAAAVGGGAAALVLLPIAPSGAPVAVGAAVGVVVGSVAAARARSSTC
jgi:predicted branched-subunit amino acid permease